MTSLLKRSRSVLSDRFVVAVLVAAFVLGVVLRLGALPTVGLWQDDAWVALSGRLGFTTAMRTAGTAPGFTAALHPWLTLAPTNPTWAALPALVLACAGLAICFAFLGQFGLSPRLCALGAAIWALSPVAIATAGHVKPYPLDALSAMAILTLAERLRRLGELRRGWWLAFATVGTVWLSAGVLVVAVGAWGALVVFGGALRRRALVAPAVASAAGLAVLYRTCFAHLPTALTRYWAEQGDFLAPGHLAHHTSQVARGLLQGFWPTWTAIPHEVLGLLAVWAILLLSGVSAGRRTAVATGAVVVAVAAAAASKVPLGTGRTDLVLYPALLLLTLVGAEQLAHRLRTWWGAPAAKVLTVALSALLVLAGVTALAHRRGYPETHVAGLAAPLNAALRPGDLVIVDPYARYPWALTMEHRLALKFSPGYGAGFTVRSTTPGVAILPAQPYEQGYAPLAWAARLAPGHRALFYVADPPTGTLVHDPFVTALVAAGWRLGPSWHQPGVSATELLAPAGQQVTTDLRPVLRPVT